LEDLGMGGIVRIEWAFKKSGVNVVEWIVLSRVSDKRQAVVNVVLEHRAT
jgi:hypothetical protein